MPEKQEGIKTVSDDHHPQHQGCYDFQSIGNILGKYSKSQ